MKKLYVVWLALLWWGTWAIGNAQDFSVARGSLADSVYQNLTIVATAYLDSVSQSRTNFASVGTGAWFFRMWAFSHDSLARYFAAAKNVPSRSGMPANFLADIRVAAGKVRVAFSLFNNGVPVANSGLDTVFASVGYQTRRFRFPAVNANWNQIVIWVSLFNGDKEIFDVYLDNIVVDGIVLEDGEPGPGPGPDITPPAIPTNLVLKALSPTALEAQAKAPNDSDVESLVFQLSTNSSFAAIDQQIVVLAGPGQSVDANFINRPPNTTHYFRAAARDFSGNQSAFSTAVSATTPPTGTTLPSPPSNFVLTGISETAVRASFVHGASAAQTEVQVAEGFAVGSIYEAQIINAVPGAQSQIVSRSKRGGTVYSGRARSINQAGFSGYTAEDTALTSADRTPPAPVTDLVATAISATQAELRFSIPSASDDVKEAIAEGSVTSDFRVFTAQKVSVSPGMSPTIVVGNLNSCTIYWWRVRLVDLSENENNSSNVDTARTFCIVTDVDRFGTIPEKFSLSQNYPNPFNPETRIVYQVPSELKVRLSVYDVFGREVRELVNEAKLPGEYEAVFNASDFPSGVYFCRMTAGDFTAARKMILVR